MNLNLFIRNIFSHHTTKKYVVFESDDWGSLRMSSAKSYESLLSQGLPLDEGMGYRYNRYDSLESQDDIAALFEVLHTVKDCNGNPFVVTPMTLVANPDFEKIKSTDYKEYHFRTITQCYQDYNCGDVLKLYKEGISGNFFVHQFHGREHLNISSWLKALQTKDPMTTLAFDHHVWGFRHKSIKPNYQAAYDFDNSDERSIHRDILDSGLNLFYKIFGYQPSHFAPPNGIIDPSLLKGLGPKGIKSYVCAMKNPIPKGAGKYAIEYCLPFSRNKAGQVRVMRNCFFEPNAGNQDWVDTCLAEISTAFTLRVPAIIGNHRTSFMGRIVPSNRDSGLNSLKTLIQSIVRKWPDVEFVSTSELIKKLKINTIE